MIGPSANLQRFLATAPPGETWIDVLEITHPAWSQGYIVSSWHEPISVTFEGGRRVTTTPLAFRVDLPDAGTQGHQDMNIVLENIGGELWTLLEAAQAQPQFPIAVTWRCYTNKALTAPQASPILLSVTNVTSTPQAVQMNAQRADLINRRWPTVVYTLERWPGLFR